MLKQTDWRLFFLSPCEHALRAFYGDQESASSSTIKSIQQTKYIIYRVARHVFRTSAFKGDLPNNVIVSIETIDIIQKKAT